MKPIFQTPESTCLQTCIASLLELQIDKVPDFMDESAQSAVQARAGFPQWWMLLQSWLRERGLWMLEMQLPENMPWSPLPYPAFAIFFGTTPSGIKHAIVGKVEGDQFVPVHDPLPKAGGIKAIESIGFLIPADPLTYLRMGLHLSRIEKLAVAKINPNVALSNIWELSREALQIQDGMAIHSDNGSKIIKP